MKTKCNWLYWNGVQDGTFNDCTTLVRQMAGTMLESAHMILADRQAGRHGLLYIDFLWMVMDAVLNTAHATHIGRLGAADAHGIQDAVLEAVRRLDTHYNGALHAKVRKDVGDLLTESSGSLPAQEAQWQPSVLGILADFERVMHELGHDVFRLIAA
jgi:hypothetical protein